jgi:hypothetical protein
MMPPRRRPDEAPTLDPDLVGAWFMRGDAGRHLYFIQGRVGGLIKIGVANNPWARLKSLQGNCPVRLWLIGVIWEGGHNERRLHGQFHHLRHHGEWFRPARELLAYIAEHATDAAVPPATIKHRPSVDGFMLDRIRQKQERGRQEAS